jgi:phosphoglycolate phosphatase
VLGREPTQAELNKVMERRLHYLYQTVADSDDYRVLEGVEELLPQMLEQGYLLGLVTGNVEAAAHIKLHRSRLNRYFSYGGYGSDSTDRGELTRMALRRASVVSGGSVTPDHAFVVGDTPHDVAAAHAAGIPCVGVASHHYTPGGSASVGSPRSRSAPQSASST